jgi:hypothetical protein
MTSAHTDSGYVAIVMTLLVAATSLAVYDAYRFITLFISS